MGCPKPIDSIHPRTPSQQRAVVLHEAHARACASCHARLGALRAAEDAITVALARTSGVSAKACPSPEVLAAWIDGDRTPDQEQHLVTCKSCRDDLFAARPNDNDVTESSGTRRVLTRRSLAIAIAAAVIAAMGIGLWGINRTPGPGRSVAESSSRQERTPHTEPTDRPARNPLDSPSPTPPSTDVHQPVDERPGEIAPSPVDAPPPLDAALPFDGAPTLDAPPPIDTPLSVETAPPVDAAPLVDAPPSNAGDTSDPETTDEEGPPPPVHVTALPIEHALGLMVRGRDQREWRELQTGVSLQSGDTLKTSRTGGLTRIHGGEVYLGPRSSTSYTGRLSVDGGEAFVATQAHEQVIVEAAGNVLEVEGEAFLRVRRGGRVDVASLRGRVQIQPRQARPFRLEGGELVTLEAERVGDKKAVESLSPPAWAEELRQLAHPRHGNHPQHR